MAQKSDDSPTGSMFFTTVIDTPVGRMEICSDEMYIRSVLFRDNDERMESAEGERPECLQQCMDQLSEYFYGTRRVFDLPLLPLGTPFQLRVWSKLAEIPFGRTISYLDLAKRLGDPKTIRATGTANGKNPVAIILPCHRVIGSSGELVGYAGGQAEPDHACAARLSCDVSICCI